MEQPTENVTDSAIDLWERMATSIISIVGEKSFDALYGRSVFLTRITFPWLAWGALPPQADQRFAGLRTSLEKQTTAIASEANSLLLITFTDGLMLLIGEPETTRVLRSARGNGISDSADK